MAQFLVREPKLDTSEPIGRGRRYKQCTRYNVPLLDNLVLQKFCCYMRYSEF